MTEQNTPPLGLGQKVQIGESHWAGTITALWPIGEDVQMFIRWDQVGWGDPREVWLHSEATWIGSRWRLQEADRKVIRYG